MENRWFLSLTVIYISVSQPVGREQLLMGLQSSHFIKFHYKTVYFYYNAAMG